MKKRDNESEKNENIGIVNGIKKKNSKTLRIVHKAIIKPAGKNVKNKVRKIILNYCSY